MELHELTAHELSGMIKEKELGVVELVKAYLKRIDEIEPKLNCYITILYDKALKQAENIQAEIDRSTELPPLAGIPVALKDNICMAGIKTTCASKMLDNFIPAYNATVVDKLYKQKAVLLGKLNMDEFAMGSSTENSYYKKTRNPWDTGRVPGGSSGGSAAAVAGGEAVLTLGSDTGGSVRQPSAFCGVVGLKPTYGTVSRYGLVALASSLDQIGPIARDVTDCAMIFNAIAGKDSMDSTTAAFKHPNYIESLKNGVKGLKIGIPVECSSKGLKPDVKKAFYEAVEIFRRLGSSCEEFSLPLFEYAVPTYYIISFAESSSNLARYDGIKYGFRAENYSNIMDMYKKTRSIGFGSEVKRRIMLGTLMLSSGYYEAYYKKALKVRTLIKEAYEKAFLKYDLLLTPTAPITAYRFEEISDDPMAIYLGNIYTVSANITGLPALNIPGGFDSNGLPIGLQLIGKSYSESILFQTGYTFEQNTEFHLKKPNIK